jgi:hypothetical protein
MLTVRFWTKVSKNGDCWNWTGAVNNKGYGQFHLKGKTVLAHRVSFEDFNGPIKEGMWVLHRCDNPRCVNPNHLFLGDASTNMQDCAAKGRLGFQRLPRRGEDHSGSKLTASQVVSIREIFRAGGVTQQDLAERFGISPSQVNNIVHRRHWREVAA